MIEENYSENVDINSLTESLSEVLPAFKQLSQDGRERLLRTLATIFGIETGGGVNIGKLPRQTSSDYSLPESQGSFSEDRSMSPKEFMLQKQPQTAVERVACLAYYLTHYRDTPFFKTLEISLINTEAAQPKFANAARDVDNATKLGYLVPATKGNKQLSAAGEQFVRELPDRDSARAIMDTSRPRRKSRKNNQKKTGE
jgi:hypothetical protein